MGSLGSLSRVVSGMNAAQAGLYVTGHNMSNANTAGYVRQQVMQVDSTYHHIARDSQGFMSVGLGTSVKQIRQIRDIFLDKQYRIASSRNEYYSTRYTATFNIEVILGELQGTGRLSDRLDELWESMQELSTHTGGVETRKTFIAAAQKFIERAVDMNDELSNYQMELNEEIKKTVNRINELSQIICDMGDRIAQAEVSGDNANDYRDIRNSAIDELCSYGDVYYKEHEGGKMTVLFEGSELIANGVAKNIGLRYMPGKNGTTGSGFVEPVITSSKEILPSDDTLAPRLFKNIYSKPINSVYENDYGSLRGLMVVRGQYPADYTDSNDSLVNTIIPKIQRELDLLVHSVVTMINDLIAPKGYDPTGGFDPNYPQGLATDGETYGRQGYELFVRKNVPRYNSSGAYIAEDVTDPDTLYSLRNLKINEELVVDPGYNYLALSLTGDIDDNTLVEQLITLWKSPSDEYACQFDSVSQKKNFKDFYNDIIVRLGNEGSFAEANAEAALSSMTKADNDRLAIMSVSLDEEMTSMLKYQHAYNAAARIFNVIDSMIDKLVNGTGRVGL